MPQIFSYERKSEIRKQLILRGRQMMLERGITGMNIEEIAFSAGIAKGTFYNFFPSKQKFILEIFYDYEQEKIDRLRELAEEKKGQLSVDEMLEWYKTLYIREENPMFGISRKDMEWIRKKIPPEELFRPEIDIETGRLIISMLKDARSDIDYRVLANFPKMIELAVQNSDSLHSEVLDVNFQMIIGLMISYVTGERN